MLGKIRIIFKDPQDSKKQIEIATPIFDLDRPMEQEMAKTELQRLAKDKGLTSKEVIKILKEECVLPGNPSS